MKRYTYTAAALIALAILAAGLWKAYDMGGDSVRADWGKETAAREAAEKTAILDRIEDNRRAKEKEESDRAKLKKGYANEIAKIRADHARDAATGLHVDASICSGFAGAGETESAGGSDAGVAATVLLPESTERDLRALMLEADTVVASCRVGQEFIRINGMAP